MTTLSAAEKKWERRMANAGKHWKEVMPEKTDDWAKGMAKFLGLPKINNEKIEAFQEGIKNTKAEDFQSAVEGKGPIWAKRLKEVFM